MTVTYISEGIVKTTSVSNQEILITENETETKSVVNITANKNIELISAQKEFQKKYQATDLFFLNGYQSWTDSFEYSYTDKLRDARKFPKLLNRICALDKYGDSHFYKYQKNVLHAIDVSYVKGSSDFFIANNNYKTAYLIIEHHKNEGKLILKSDVEGIKLSQNQTSTIFDYTFNDDIEKGKAEYFSQFPAVKAEKLIGYTSWYNHYQDINEEIIMDALHNMDEHFDLFQIDDGFEPYVGDWLTVDLKKFPDGLKKIVQTVHEKNMKAGVWLAPFAAETKSEVFKNHRDWFCKDKNGNPVKCGANWSGFYALDINNPHAVDYVKKTLNYYKDLGFDFFKLDFLYAASVVNLPGLSRAQTAQKAYELLRQELSDKLILGCGAVVSNSFALFDYLRIGPDVSLIFDDVWYMHKLLRERLSTKVTVRNTIYRSLFNGKVFLNDPDVFLLRSDNISLNKKQREALTTINSLFGSLLMTSDNPKYYGEEEKAFLNNAIQLFKNAEVKNVTTKDKVILIEYSFNQKNYEITYDIEKGILN